MRLVARDDIGNQKLDQDVRVCLSDSEVLSVILCKRNRLLMSACWRSNYVWGSIAKVLNI